MPNGGLRERASRALDALALPRAVMAVLPYLAATAGIALVTVAIAWVGSRVLANASLLYLIVVLVAAVVFGRAVAIYSALLAFFTFNWFLTEPRHTLAVADPDDWILLLLFLLTAVVTGQLAAAQRKRAEEAEEQERQARVLYDIAVALTEPTLERTLTVVADRIRDELGVTTVEIEMRAGARRSRATSSGPAPAAPDEGRAIEMALSDASQGRGGRWMRVSPPHGQQRRARGTLRVARAAIRSPGGEEVGEISLVAPTDRPFDEAAARLLAAVAPQLWVALERARLYAEATEAEVLRRSDEAKSALLDAVSHDLRTPLASIIASAGSLRQTDVAWSPDERAAFAGGIEHEARRLDRIVGNLLDLSRIRAGALRPDRGWYEPVALMRDVVDRLRPTIGHHRLVMDTPEELPPVPMDYSEIDQVLTNLVENAARHSDPHAVITVAASVADGVLEVHVDDSGPGIDAGELPRIFDAFYRSPRGTHGSGLGLAVARGLVEAHGGSIWAERRNGGTRFAFRIPAGEDES